MLCPFCGAETEKGALHTGKDHIIYINKPHNKLFGVIPDRDGGEMDLTENGILRLVFGPSRFPAYRCAACQKLILDYSGQAEEDPAFKKFL